MKTCPVALVLFNVLALTAVRDTHAQERATDPWTVTVAPTLNPLPIGLCAAVLLTVVDPKTGEPPRNPQGNRVSMADFDMAITPATPAFAGQQIDSSHWSICGCPGSSPGEAATITATYPARSSSVRARVSGVALQATATLTTSNAKGATAPAACAAVAGSNPAPVAGSSPAPAASAPVLTALPLAPPPIALAPEVPTLTPVLKTEWAIPPQGNVSLSSGLCTIVNGVFTDARILPTDTVVVTGQAAFEGAYLKWTGVVDTGAVHLNVCNWKKMTLSVPAALYLNGRKVNILVLR